MYVAQARFVLDRAPGAIDLSHYVTLDFLERIDPAIKHKLITPADVVPFTDEAGTGNQNPDRKWCTGRANLICLQSTYTLEGKIPLGIMLVNKLRENCEEGFRPHRLSERVFRAGARRSRSGRVAAIDQARYAGRAARSSRIFSTSIRS